MNELLLENLKNYGEVLVLKQSEKKELLKEINAHKKMERMTEEFKKNGVEIIVPPIDNKMEQLQKIETEIKMCKSIIRRYENVIQMYEVGIEEDGAEEQENI